VTDFYQSPSDKIRLEMMLASLSEGGLNLAILGDDEVALSAYARRIYEHLKTLPDAQVDLCLSADADKLVARFNQILSELTLDEALDKSQKAPVKRYLIFPDTQAVQDFELQLLARLINGLPASNIHVVLLLNRREPYEKKLKAFGKHLVQWILESEHPSSFANGAALLGEEESPFKSTKDELASKGTMSSQAFKQQFAQRGFGVDSAPSSSPAMDGRLEPGFEEDVHREPTLSEVELMAAIKAAEEKWSAEHRDPKGESDSSQEGDLPDAPKKSSKLGWGLLLGFLLSVSALAALYKDALMAEAQHMKEYLTGPQWDQGKKDKPSQEPTESASNAQKSDAAPGEVKEASPLTTPAGVGMSSSNKPPPVKVDDSLIPEREAILTPEKTDNKDPAKGALKQAAQEPSKQDSKEPVKALTKESPKEVVKEVSKETSKEISKPTAKEVDKEPVKESKAVKSVEPPLKEPPLKIPLLKDPPLPEPKGGASKPKEVVPAKAAKESSNAGGVLADKVMPSAWVSGLPAKAWVLQLAAMPTKAEIMTLKQETPAFASAQVLLTQNPQSKKPYYILVRGPFASKEVAQNLMSSTPALSKAWLRSAQSLKNQFQPQAE
jgi:hypothetical protein